ncbi:MAG TPA: gluconeogenesis factor YvcK family protein [Anaerolineae bacterium]
MSVKRWLLLLVIGLVCAALALAALLQWLASTDWWVSLPHAPAGLWSSWPFNVVLFLAGAAAMIAGVFGLNRSLLSAFRRGGQGEVVDVVYSYRQRQRGPKVVAIGGGHGLSTLLRGLKDYTDNITAVLTVADDGGSSGRLRRDLGMLPPGDFRNCIAALSNAEGLMGELFQYRFGDDSGLGGHSFGNLYITAMAAITGSFESALSESGRVLAVRGRVIPSTLSQVNLCADIWLKAPEETVDAASSASSLPARPAAAVKNGRLTNVCGESKIPTVAGRIQRVYLDPEDAPAYPEAIRAILEADLIVAGPGSLYTSVLPNLLVRDLAQAVRASAAPKVYVCNVATQPGETEGFDVTAHVDVLRDHLGPGVFDAVLANNTFRLDRPPGGGADFVRLPGRGAAIDYELMAKDLVDGEYPWRHDPDKLARAVLEFVRT